LVEKRKSEFIFSSEVTLSTIQFERASYFMWCCYMYNAIACTLLCIDLSRFRLLE
jgi:hypothetical protein